MARRTTSSNPEKLVLPKTRMIKSLSPRLFRALSLKSRDPGQDDLSGRENGRHPSPSLVPLPAHVTSLSIKDRLPLMQYGEFLERKPKGVELGGAKGDGVCIVCMEGLDGSDEVREQGNCSHICHRECLDAWIDRDHDACPLCRSRLLPSDDNEREREDGGDYDPWRAERMVYLFGEDCCF